ncbi:MAG: hypothetical protein HY048_19535 [Acidobacteria bacterium]|nr:hypothetical protein [Acidobacteriota bacterium]
MRWSRLAACVLLVCAAGCSRPLVNSDCEWPRTERLRNLNDNALFAEDLAIRYADAHRGRRSGHFVDWDQYDGARETCMATLFAVVADAHHVTPARVREALTHRGVAFDGVVLLSFLAMYVFVVSRVVRRIFRSAPDHPAFVLSAVVIASIVLSVLGVAFLHIWAGAAEVFRVGNQHVSYRGERVPWRAFMPHLFAAGVIVVWATAARHYRVVAGGEPTPEVTSLLD